MKSEMYFKTEDGKKVDATADNIARHILNNPYQEPKSREEEREIEDKYMTQLGKRVKCYHDGNNNIIEFLD